jgi:ferredoxin-thioredoxin reductase catalytic subunit
LLIRKSEFLDFICISDFCFARRKNCFCNGCAASFPEERNRSHLTTYHLQDKVKGKVKQFYNTPMEAQGERMYSSYSFTTLALDGVEWSTSRPGRALPPGSHCTGGWVGPRAGLDTEDRGKIFCPCQGSNPDRPVIQSVVRHYTD